MKNFIIGEQLVNGLFNCIKGSAHPKFSFEEVAQVLQALQQLCEHKIEDPAPVVVAKKK